MRVTDDLPWIYGAALAAAATEEIARDVAEQVATTAARDASRSELVARAIRSAVRVAPAAPFAGLAEEEREALALVRLGGFDVTEVARQTGTDPREVKRRLGAALRALAGQPLPLAQEQPSAEPPRREGRGLRSVSHPKFLQYVPHVRLHRRLRDHQPVGDLAVP